MITFCWIRIRSEKRLNARGGKREKEEKGEKKKKKRGGNGKEHRDYTDCSTKPFFFYDVYTRTIKLSQIRNYKVSLVVLLAVAQLQKLVIVAKHVPGLKMILMDVVCAVVGVVVAFSSA